MQRPVTVRVLLVLLLVVGLAFSTTIFDNLSSYNTSLWNNFSSDDINFSYVSDQLRVNGTTTNSGYAGLGLSNPDISTAYDVNISLFVNLSNTSVDIPGGNGVGVFMELNSGNEYVRCIVLVDSSGAYQLALVTNGSSDPAQIGPITTNSGNLSLFQSVSDGNVTCRFDDVVFSNASNFASSNSSVAIFGAVFSFGPGAGSGKIDSYMANFTAVYNVIPPLYVNNSDAGSCVQGANYDNISAALAAAVPGSTITVCKGSTYVEDVNISVENLTIQGNETGVIVKPTGDGQAVFFVNASGVSISNFTIIDTAYTGGDRGAGIQGNGNSTQLQISNVILSNHSIGIAVTGNNSQVIGNTIFDTALGIGTFDFGGGTSIYGIEILSNNITGVGATLFGGDDISRGLDFSATNSLSSNNTISNFTFGVFFNGAIQQFVNITNSTAPNLIYGNTYGIWINTSNVSVVGNLIQNNSVGIQLEEFSANISHTANNLSGNVIIYNSSNVSNFFDEAWSYLDIYNFAALFTLGGLQLNKTISPGANPGYTNVGGLYLNLTNWTSDANASIVFVYTDADLGSVQESSLMAYVYSGSSWTLVSSSYVDMVDKVVFAENITSDFGIFAIFGQVPVNISVSIQSPANDTYNNSTIQLNYTTVGVADKCWYSNNSGLINYTIASCANITISSYEEGNHTITVYVNDSSNNVNSSNISFTVDTVAPAITIQSPTATTYASGDISLEYTVVGGYDSCWYSNDSGVINSSYYVGCPNATITDYADGSHTITVYVNDSMNNVNSSNVTFSVSTPVQVQSTSSGVSNPLKSVDLSWSFNCSSGVLVAKTLHSGSPVYDLSVSLFRVSDYSSATKITDLLGEARFNITSSGNYELYSEPNFQYLPVDSPQFNLQLCPVTEQNITNATVVIKLTPVEPSVTPPVTKPITEPVKPANRTTTSPVVTTPTTPPVTQTQPQTNQITGAAPNSTVSPDLISSVMKLLSDNVLIVVGVFVLIGVILLKFLPQRALPPEQTSEKPS